MVNGRCEKEFRRETTMNLKGGENVVAAGWGGTITQKRRAMGINYRGSPDGTLDAADRVERSGALLMSRQRDCNGSRWAMSAGSSMRRNKQVQNGKGSLILRV